MLSQSVFVLKIKIKRAFALFTLREVSVLAELAFRTPALPFDRLYRPSQTPRPDTVFRAGRQPNYYNVNEIAAMPGLQLEYGTRIAINEYVSFPRLTE